MTHNHIHRFSHTFSDGSAITLAIDMAQNPPSIAAHPMGLASKHPKEYGVWLHDVIVPALLELASEEQVDELAVVGLRAVSRMVAREGSE